MAGSIHLVLLLLLLGSTNTAKLSEEVNKQTDEEVKEEIENETKEQVSDGLNLNSLLSIDIDLDKMVARAEDVVRRFGVDENTLRDVKKYLHGNERIASSAKSARLSLSKGKQMLREVSQLHLQYFICTIIWLSSSSSSNQIRCHYKSCIKYIPSLSSSHGLPHQHIPTRWDYVTMMRGGNMTNRLSYSIVSYFLSLIFV